MKVLIIAQYFPPDMGGGATRAYNVAKGLKLNGCQVTVIAAFPHYPNGNVPEKYRWKPFVLENFQGLRVIRTFVPPLASSGLAKRLVLFLSFIVSALWAFPFVREVDVVWAANPNVLSIFPALFYGFVKGRSVALNVDDLWPEELHSTGFVNADSFIFKLMRFVARFAYSKAMLITPISPGYGEVICNDYGVDERKVHVVWAGVDLDTFRVDSERPDLDDEVFKVVYSGAFSVAYDFDQVLLAAKKLEDVDKIEFVLQGGGEFIEYVKSKVKRLKLANVRVIDKIYSRAKVAKLLSEADVLILPLRDFGKPYLGISSKLYEYQAAGKPIICCAYGQPAEYVKETCSGIVVKPGDFEGLVRAVLFLKQNPEYARRMGLSGRRYVEEHLSIQAIGLELKRVLEAKCKSKWQSKLETDSDVPQS
ncbi:MAG: glycosyltransferase family 4 protein [Candidatus Bathyarchaeia archaeon]